MPSAREDDVAIDVVPFEDVHAKVVRTWVTGAEEARAWAGARETFPVTAVRIREWHDDPDVHAFVGTVDTQPVAYGECWWESNIEAELARIVVDPTRRGEGLGTAFVRGLVDEVRTDGPAIAVFVRVVPDNSAALNCYRRAGFVPVPKDDRNTFNRGQPVDYVWLHLAGE